MSCAAAYSEQLGVVRYEYQLGCTLLAANKPNEALIFIRSTDTLGQLIGSLVHGADIQDRDGAPDVLKSIRHAFPWLRHIFADAAYAGPKLRGLWKRLAIGRRRSSNVPRRQGL